MKSLNTAPACRVALNSLGLQWLRGGRQSTVADAGICWGSSSVKYTVKTSQNFTETSPPAHTQADNLTYMTALAEDCCEKTKQANSLLRGAKFNLCLYLQNKKRWDYPSACLHQRHLLSEESIDSETQTVISSHSSRAHALCSPCSCVRVQACKKSGGTI